MEKYFPFLEHFGSWQSRIPYVFGLCLQHYTVNPASEDSRELLHFTWNIAITQCKKNSSWKVYSEQGNSAHPLIYVWFKY